MLVTKDTEASNSRWFALQDIDARAKAAYNTHKALFNSREHRTRVELVDSILRTMLFSYTSAYQTARGATKRKPAHTEVKYDRVVQYSTPKHRELRERAVEQLAALGLDLVYKPKTNSYSVHVF